MDDTGTQPEMLVARLDDAHARVTSAQRDLLETLALLSQGPDDVWTADGHPHLAAWVAARYGVTTWAALRWIAAAARLGDLPGVRAALGSGALSLDRSSSCAASPRPRQRPTSFAGPGGSPPPPSGAEPTSP